MPPATDVWYTQPTLSDGPTVNEIGFLCLETENF